MRYKLFALICMLTLWISFSFTGKSASSVMANQDIEPQAANRNIIPPIKKKKLLAWLKAGNYKQMFTPEPAVHTSTGPHGGNVLTFYNPILVEDLRAGKTVFSQGAAMVKELYFSGTQQVIGYSVMVKTDASTVPNANSWIFYETFNSANDNAFYGRGIPLCANCHGGGLDYLLSTFRPN